MKTMEHFFVEDTFYSEVEDYIEDQQHDEESVHALPDDWKCAVFECELAPMVKLSPEWISERIDEDMITEDGENIDRLEDILKKYIDFEKVNSMIPKVWMPKGPQSWLTKTHLIDAL